MKRVLALILIVVLCLSTMACGESAVGYLVEESDYEDRGYKVALAARDYLYSVHYGDELDGLVFVGFAISDVWYAASSGSDLILDTGVLHLAALMGVTVDEVTEGVVYYLCGGTDDSYERATNAEKEEYRADVKQYQYFKQYEDDLLHFCVMVAIGTAKTNGSFDEIEENLALARNQLEYLRINHPDDKNYPDLQNYYEMTSDFLAYCKNPTGSWEDMSDAVQKYSEEMNISSYYPVAPKTERWVEEKSTASDGEVIIIIGVIALLVILVVFLVYRKRKVRRSGNELLWKAGEE